MNVKFFNRVQRGFGILLTSFFLSALLILGCGEKSNQSTSQPGSDQPTSNNNNSNTSTNDASGLTPFQLKNGIGPITQLVSLSAINKNLVKKGEKIFETKCASCHKLDERYVGPAQRNLVERRSPEYIMNMMLNPAEMLAKHPEAKKLLAEYMTQMPNQNLSMDDARALLEFFRQVDKNKKMDKD